MVSSDDSTPLFVDTNLGTHLALPVSPEITAGDLKCKLVQEHLCCFTNMGEIKAHRLMVKRRSHFYLLTDSMPIKIAFQGSSGTWFLQMHASQCQTREYGENVKPPKIIASQNLIPSNKLHKCQSRDYGENQHAMSGGNDVTACSQPEAIITFSDKNTPSLRNAEVEVLLVAALPKENANGRGKGTIEGRPVGVKKSHVLEVVSDISSRQQQFREKTTVDECFNQNDNRHLASDNPLERQEREEEYSMNISEKISITGIISRYFSEFDEVDSCSHQPNPKLKETNDSTTSASEYSVGQKSSKRVVGSDADTVCSITRMDLDGNLFGSNFVDTDAVMDSARPRKAVASKKTRKTTSFKFSKQASRCQKFFTPPSNSNKHEVGKRISQAANSIRMSDNGKSPFKSMFVSRYQKLSAPELNVLVRSHAFDLDEFDD